MVLHLKVKTEADLEGVHLLLLFMDYDWGTLNPNDPIGVLQIPLKDLLKQQKESGGFAFEGEIVQFGVVSVLNVGEAASSRRGIVARPLLTSANFPPTPRGAASPRGKGRSSGTRTQPV